MVDRVSCGSGKKVCLIDARGDFVARCQPYCDDFYQIDPESLAVVEQGDVLEAVTCSQMRCNGTCPDC